MKAMLWKFILFTSISTLSLTAHAEWQCYAADKGGHLWESKGFTQEHANAVALSFCTAYSPDSSSCHTSNCAEKS